MPVKEFTSAVAAIALTFAGAIYGQQLTEQQAAGGQFKIDDQGTQIKPQAQRHLDAADRAAGKDFIGSLLLCNQARPAALRRAMPTAAELINEGRSTTQPAEPTRVFDNLYYLGAGNVASWAVVTSAGIIVLDALNNRYNWIDHIEPGMRKLGIDPAQIKYVIVTHGHGDHFGGAAYLSQRYRARIMMSDADWTLSPSMLDKPFFEAAPVRDMVIKDGDKLELGGQTLTLYITPGHTLGSVSVLVPVTDKGQSHTAVVWGGTGFNFPHSPARFKQYSDSALRLMNLALTAGADTPLSGHSEIDRALQKIASLQQRGANDPHPFVMGQDGIRRFFTTLSECALAYGTQMTE